MSKMSNKEKVFEIDTHINKQYDVIKRLGKGAYGIVWKAVDKKTQKTVAVKKIFDAFRNQTDAQRTFREIMFLLSFSNHENIIRLQGLHKASNDRDIYLVFEFMECDLHNVIKRGNILKNIHKIYIIYQLFKAIKYIHSGNVIHRDLKPSNILLNSQCHCKIADFGLARSVMQIGEGDGEVGSDPALTDYVATRWYRAPEILIASKRYTKGIDMWSLGCIFGEMMLGKPLFPGTSTVNQIERIMSVLPMPTQDDIISLGAGYGSTLLEQKSANPHYSLEELLPDISEEALDLIKNLIVFNPSKRLTAVEALEHPYVANFHKRSQEPERGSKVIPWLSDDIQLSVDEYRNKLYALMDNKNKKQKNMSKSRVRRSSDNLRKENVEQVTSTTSNMIVKKSFHASCDDLRRESKYCVKDVATKEKHNGYEFFTNKVSPPIQSKSCVYYSHQKPVSKVQRPIQQDPININGLKKTLKLPSVPQSKSRQFSIPQYNSSTLSTTKTKSCMSYNFLSRQPNQEVLKSQKKSLLKVAGVTKHFVHSDETKSMSQNNIIQNYLNQTVMNSIDQTIGPYDAHVTDCKRGNHPSLKKSVQQTKQNDVKKALKKTVSRAKFASQAHAITNQNSYFGAVKSNIPESDCSYDYNKIDAKNYSDLLKMFMKWSIK